VTCTCHLQPGSNYKRKPYSGGWHRIEAGKIPVIMLVKEGTSCPHRPGPVHPEDELVEDGPGRSLPRSQEAKGLSVLPSTTSSWRSRWSRRTAPARGQGPLQGKVTFKMVTSTGL